MLERKAEELFSTMDKFMNLAVKEAVSFKSMSEMDENELNAFKLMAKTMDESKEFCMEMAKQLDKINELDRKIDELLAMKGKES